MPPTIRPDADYFLNGPIPPADLAYLDFLQSYFEYSALYYVPEVHFMLESISKNGAPNWWPGSVAQFQEEFHQRYSERLNQSIDPQWLEDAKWRAAEAEV